MKEAFTPPTEANPGSSSALDRLRDFVNAPEAEVLPENATDGNEAEAAPGLGFRLAKAFKLFKNPEGKPNGTETGESEEEFEPSHFEKTKQALSVMGEKAKAFFGTMSEKGQAAATAIYEGIYNTPGVQRLAGKLEISFNQFFVDHHEKNAIGLREKSEGMNTKIDAIERTARETEAAIETLRQLGSPGLAGLERKVIDLDNQKLDLLLTQETIGRKIDSRVSKMEHFKGQRDIIADRLIGTYSEKIAPIEQRLESLENSKRTAEAQAEITRAEHQLQLQTLTELEQRRNSIATVLESTGLTEKQVQRHEILKMLDKEIGNGREKIRSAEEGMQARLADINHRIGQSNERTQGYQLKQGEFENLKRDTIDPERLRTTSINEAMTDTPEAPVQEDIDLVEETFEYLKDHLTASPDGKVSKEDRETILEALLTEQPEICERLTGLYKNANDEQTQNRHIELFQKAWQDINIITDIEGLAMQLPTKDGEPQRTLTFDRSKQGTLSLTVTHA